MFDSTRREIQEMIGRSLFAHSLCSHDARPIIEKHYICETCGCYIAPEFAVAGEKEIRQKENRDAGCWWEKDGDAWCRRFQKEDYIYTPYFCKVHAPKVKK
jgi:hypothetical protein